MRNLFLTAGLAGVLALAGCGGSEAPKTAESSAPAAGAGGTAMKRVAFAATVTGKVAFDGTAPTMKTLDMSATPFCEKAHAGAPVKSEEVVVNGNGTLKNAFVWIKSGLPDKNWAVPATPVTLDQHGCMYSPQVVGLMTGQNLDIKTSDQTNHNIHPMPTGNQEFNESQAPGSEDKMKSFPRQEVMIPVRCDVHPWMRSWIGVVAHPYFAVTGSDGEFSLRNVPPGDYVVASWHERFGTRETRVPLGAKDTKDVSFAYTAP